MHSTHASDPCSALGNRVETRDSPEFSQNAGQAKVPAPIFTKTSSKTGSKRADEGADRRRRRNATTPSDLGLSAHCSADCFSLRRRYRQRRGPPDPHHSLPSGSRIGRSVLAFLYGSREHSLLSLDLFSCESVALQTYWVLVVMDQYTRRIIGFGIQRGVVDGLALCRMFNRAFTHKHCRSISAPIMIRCFCSTGGRPI